MQKTCARLLQLPLTHSPPLAALAASHSDVGVVLSKGQSIDDAERALKRFAAGQQLGVQTVSNGDTRVRRLVVSRAISEGRAVKLDVELVDVEAWASKSGKKVDFDVSNLKLVARPPGYDYKYAGQGGSLDQIVANALAKRMRVLKDTATDPAMPGRIAKMQNRGWSVV